MPNINGPGPKRAILYARVSTEEQARSGYSLAQQMEALRDYTTREGYKVLEEVTDPAQSGASLVRPGMDRVRDLVATGGVSVVLAQERDRFSREPAYRYLLQQEFEEQDCKLQALNDRGDDSPEGELTDGILDQLAKFERAKTAERTRRGKLRKVREGKIIADGRGPTYGFDYNESRDGYMVDEITMTLVRRIFEMVATGMAIRSVKKQLEAEGVPAPRGGKTWSTRTICAIMVNDCYLPHTTEELSKLISPEVVGRLDSKKLYGISWYGKRRVTVKQVADRDADGRRRYHRKQVSTLKPREEWTGVPVPAGWVPRPLVEAAREAIKDNITPSKAGSGERFWELSGGIIFCGECGRRMTPDCKKDRNTEVSYYYYRCNTHRDKGSEACPNRKKRRAEHAEAEVWSFVSSLLQNPEELKRGLERLIEDQKSTIEPKRDTRALLRRIEEFNQQRARAQALAIDGLLSHEELRAKLSEIEERQEITHNELATVTSREERVEQLERDADALLSSYCAAVPEALATLTGEERQQVYKMLRLKVCAYADATTRVTGALVSEGQLCIDERTPRPTTIPHTVSNFQVS
jgi:site-specific DNA recombinase